MVFNAFEPESTEITLEMSSLNNYQKVIANVKVLTTMESINMSGGEKTKQDVMVGDQTGTMKVTLWEEHVDSLLAECSNQLKNFIVREYASQKYLSMPRVGAVITN